MQVRILDAAEQDIEDAYGFYERQATGLGVYFMDSLYADIDSLAFFGGIHEKAYGRHRLLARRFPFAIYYLIDGGEVLVTAVLDCRRNPNWTRERLM